MKSDLFLAITQLAAEKNLPKEVVIRAVETALVAAFKKDSFTANTNIFVKLTPQAGGIEVYINKTVVEKVEHVQQEISLDDARKINPNAQIDDVLEIESTPPNAGRIAAQTAKQVVLERLHEAERDAVFAEYSPKQGEIISGIIQQVDHRQVRIDLNRTEAIMPANEQIPGERYRTGQRIKVYLMEVLTATSGPQLIVSRAHPAMLKRLFEMEVPEIHNNIIELKAITREAGYRSKVAVTSRQQGVDPIGCCVGLRGIRIQNIVAELNGEKIDVVQWNPDVATFITNALSPATTVRVDLDQEIKKATVVVPDKQLSLAIGKDGQNARLAAKLTGWRIDLKSASTAAAEATPAPAIEVPAQVEEKEQVAPAEQVPVVKEVPVVKKAAEVVEVTPPVVTTTPVTKAKETAEEPVEVHETEFPEEEAEEESESIPVTEMAAPFPVRNQTESSESQIRFAEDILMPENKGSRSKKRKGARFTRTRR